MPNRTSPFIGQHAVYFALSKTYYSFQQSGRWEQNPELHKLVGQTKEFFYRWKGKTFYMGTYLVLDVIVTTEKDIAQAKKDVCDTVVSVFISSQRN